MPTITTRQLHDIQDAIVDVLRKELRCLIPQFLDHVRIQRAVSDPETDPLISRAQAARILGVSIQTISKMIRNHRLACVKVQRRTLLRKSDITKYMEIDAASFSGEKS